MSRNQSRFIPGDEVAQATDWQFAPVDQASLRFAARLKAEADAEEAAKAALHRQAGFDEGYNKGYAEGYAQAHAAATLDGERKIQNFIDTQGAEAARAFANLLASSHAQIEAGEQAMAEGLLELACGLARQVLLCELAINPNAVLPVLRESLGLLIADAKSALVRLNPADVDVVEPVVREEFPGLQIKLLPDASIQSGGCQVESNGTVVDGRVATRWGRVVARLGLESSWETADADD